MQNFESPEVDKWQPVDRATLPDSFKILPGGLAVGRGIVENPVGCWQARVRNPSRRRYGNARWLWIDQTDPRAVARYRRRVCHSVTGSPPQPWSRLEPTCGNPACLNPDHLDLIELPAPEYRPPEAGRYAWILEEGGAGEFFGWIPDPPRCSESCSPDGRKPAPAPKGKVRGERHGKSKLTADDVRAIRAAADGDRRRGSETSQKALAARFGISSAAVRKILTRRSWSHIM